MAQHLGLEHVDAGVDRVREHLAPRRLLEEALDPALLVGDDDPELERVLDRLQADRDRRPALAVELDELAEVDVAEGVARDDEDGVVELSGGEPDGAGGAERRLLDRVLDPQAEPLAGPEVAADRLRQERERDDHVVEAVALEQLEDVLHARLADDRHHRLRLVRGQRPQPRALPTRHHDRSHVPVTSMRRSAADRTPGGGDVEQPGARPPSRGRSRRSTSGHGCSSCVTSRKPTPGVEHPGRELAEEADRELVPPREHEPRTGEEHRVPGDDDDQRRPGQPVGDERA